ncbi:hypothetical protein C0993_006669 [Termitomyces sp. T159_Od127]|nr:hypothetical protein C0993_006669 [Termitomyces sp. T159_Od127]
MADQEKPDGPHKEHHWYEDKGKLGLAAIGGGVAAAVLGGGIHHLIRKHEEKEDEEEGRANWINEARVRTEQFHREGPRGPATWLLIQGKDFPPRALEVGREDSWPRDIYEILVGDTHGLRWEPARGKLHVNELGFKPVEGGHENDGSPIYIIRANYKGGHYPGKASATLDGEDNISCTSVSLFDTIISRRCLYSRRRYREERQGEFLSLLLFPLR